MWFIQSVEGILSKEIILPLEHLWTSHCRVSSSQLCSLPTLLSLTIAWAILKNLFILSFSFNLPLFLQLFFLSLPPSLAFRRCL